MISSAYVAHYNAPKFWKELKNPTRPRYNLVVTSVFLASFLVYVTVVLAGFLTFGGHSSGFILNNYASADSLATVARLAIGAGIVFGYPLTFSALRDGALELLNVKGENKEKAFLPATIGLLGVLTGSALVLKNVGAVVSLGGALIGAMLIFTIPAIMNIRNLARFAVPGANANANVSLELVANYAMAAMGAVVAVIGVYANQKSMGGGH